MAKCGTANHYPAGQCTVYADERYHDLTGCFVPWSGNAWQWDGLARAAGWHVSSSPSVPSIMCLQGGTQGASALGHVGVVEQVNNDGSFISSNLNWRPHPTQVTQIRHTPGAGVSFLSSKSTSSKKTQGVSMANIQGKCTPHGLNTSVWGLNFLSGIGNNNPTPNTQKFVIGWEQEEGGGQTNCCDFNALNTEQQTSTSRQCPGPVQQGIQAYSGYADGAIANAKALMNGRYPSLLHALQTNDETNLGMGKSPMATNIINDLAIWVGHPKGSAAAYDYAQHILHLAGSAVILKTPASALANNPNPASIPGLGVTGTPCETFFGANSAVCTYLNDPMRILKIVTGLGLILIAIFLLAAPAEQAVSNMVAPIAKSAAVFA